MVSHVGSHRPSCLNEKQHEAEATLSPLDVGSRFTACRLDIASHKLAELDSSSECSRALSPTSPDPDPLANSNGERIGLKTAPAHNKRAGGRSTAAGVLGDDTAAGRNDRAGVSCPSNSMNAEAFCENRSVCSSDLAGRSTSCDLYVGRAEDDRKEVRNDNTCRFPGESFKKKQNLHTITRSELPTSNYKGDGLHKPSISFEDVLVNNQNNDKLQTEKQQTSQIKNLNKTVPDKADFEACTNTATEGFVGEAHEIDHESPLSSSSAEEGGRKVKDENNTNRTAPIYPWMKSQYGKQEGSSFTKKKLIKT